MHNTRLLACVGMLALVAVLGSAWPSVAQAPTPTPAPTAATPDPPGADVNPIIHNCPVVNDTVGNPPRSRPAKDVLTSGQPCERVANTTGIFPNDQPGHLLNLQHGFDFYSWLTFIALNSPADGKSILQSTPNGRTNWEDPANYQQLADIMLRDGSTPTWGKRDYPEICLKQFGPDKTIIHVEEDVFNQPFKSGPLIDQNSNYAVFDILMNRVMFDYVLTRGLYSRVGQRRFKEPIEFPSGEAPQKPDGLHDGRMGAVMLKVSWRILDPVKDRAVMNKFHTIDALVYLPGGDSTKAGPACVRKTLGLVGFHVGHKTAVAPQWIWTTFEHVDNAPQQKDVEAKKIDPKHVYNFYDPSPAAASRSVNQTPPQPWDPDPSFKFRDAYKSQITRTIAITPEAEELNKDFRSALKGTVWENYMLISTQWPSNPGCATDKTPSSEPDPSCAPVPAFLANTTLETYSQGDIPVASSSCMACHNDATTFHEPNSPNKMPSDFTFTLEKAH